jgi:argininosuccinate lyase
MLPPVRLLPLLLVGAATPPLTAAPVGTDDLPAHFLEANRAQIVMLAERGLLPAEQCARIAAALRVYAAEQAAAARPSANYLQLENRLVQLVGPEASNLHLGRSNNDLGETINRMVLRDRLLRAIEAIAPARAHLHRLAEAHVDSVMPGYTHGVQAQPTTVAHFLLAFDAGLQRDTDRLRELYARLNRSPLGSGAFTTSGFALDRERLAALLGFDGIVENSYDAIMVAAADSKVELAGVLGLSALGIGRFTQSLLFQYADPVPGFILTGPIVGRSSIMPQKRNPSAVERLRLAASEVLANAHASALFAHNTPLYEVKDVREDHLERLARYCDEALAMYHALARVLDSLTIQPEVLRQLVDADFSTMTELADTLLREAGVPFRTGYRVASALADFGRAEGRTPVHLTHAQVDAVYRQVTGRPLPLTPEQVRNAFDPAAVVAARQGTGGPQPAEVRRMLALQQAHAAAASSWTTAARHRLQSASAELHRLADALADRAPPATAD